MVPTKDPASMVGELQKRVCFAERTSGGLKYIFETGLGYFEKLLNAFLKLFGKESVSWGDQTDKLLSQWSKRVDDFELLSLKGNPTISELQGAMALMQEGIGFRQMLKTPYNIQFLNKYIDRLTGAIQAHRGALNQANSFRMQPLTVMLGGGSGVGKTTVIKWLASAVMLLSGAVDAEEILNNMWQKGISEYWNGYVQQFCYVMDDCFQQKTVGSQQDNEAMFLIRAVGNWAFPLNFADVDSKGRFYFTSDMIVGSTNVDDIESAVSGLVMEPKAVTRRIEHGHWTFVRPEFQIGGEGPRSKMLDYRKVSNYIKTKRAQLVAPYTVEDVLDCIPWHAWELVPHDFGSAKPEGPKGGTYSLRDLAREIAAQYVERKKQHTDDVTELEDWSRDLARGLKPQSGSDDPSAPKGDVDSFDPEGATPIHPAISDEFKLGDPIEPAPAPDYSDLLNNRPCAKAFEDIGIDTNRPTTPEDDEAFIKRTRALVHAQRDAGRKSRVRWLYDAGTNAARFLCDKGASIVGALLSDFWEDTKDNWDPSTPPFGLKRTAVYFLRAIAIGAVVGVACSVIKGAIGGLTALVGKFFGKENQSNAENAPKSSKNDIKFPRLETQMGVPPEDVGAELPYKNTYKIILEKVDGGQTALGQILFVEGNLAVMPAHFKMDYDEMTQGNVVLRSCAQGGHVVRIPIKEFKKLGTVRVKGCDLLFMRFDRHMVKSFRSIRNHFLTEANLKQFFKNKTNHVRLDVCRVTRGTDYVNAPVSHCTFVSNVCEFKRAACNLARAGPTDALCEYNMPTVAGDCGAPLTICEPRHYGGAGLLGIHVAGRVGPVNRTGFATVITREIVLEARDILCTYKDDVDASLKDMGVTVKPCTSAETANILQSGLVGGSFEIIGTVDKTVHVSKKSKLHPTPIQEERLWGECPVAPAHLAPIMIDGELKHPAIEAVRAYQSPLNCTQIPQVHAVMDMALKPHWRETKGYARDILTIEEAVAPPPCYKLKPIKRTSSAGYPYRTDGTVGKSDFFGKDGEYEFDSPAFERLQSDVVSMVELCKRGVRPAVIFTDFLKDETRPLAKVEACATRAISGAPLNYVIAVRMYFGAFVAAFFATSVVSGMAPGINPYQDWSVLADRLQQVGPKIFGGDFKRYDASVQPYLLEAILGYINKWYRFNNPDYDPEDERVRSMLWLDLIHSRHLTGLRGELDVLVQWNKCMPSGHPLTTVVNSMYALVTLTACYATLTGDYIDMWSRVFINTYGDDNISAVDDKVSEIFNQVTVSAQMMKLFGLVYTSDKKDAELVPHTTLENVTFLKRSFARDDEADGGWVAPLDPDSFLYIPYWCRNQRDVPGEMYRGVQQMLGELCLHPPDLWDHYYSILERFSAENNFDLPFLSREGAREWVLSRTDAWY